MKNTILWSALFTLMCTQVQADVNQTTPPSPNPATVAPSPAPTATQPEPTAQPTQTGTQPAAQPTSTSTPAAPAAQPTQPTPNPQSMQPVQPQATQVINCDYKIPAETKNIDQTLVINWSEKAVVQAFDFDPANIDAQIAKLQSCFTEPGWTGFNTALQKSGNIDAIKSQKLTVSSQVDGQAQVTDVKENQWKMTLPLQVVYQNDKEKVTQLLNVSVTIGRKLNGDLGIMQMIASPRPAVVTQPTPEPSTGTTPPAGPESGATPAAATTPTDTDTTPEVPTPSAPSDIKQPSSPNGVQTPSSGTTVPTPN